MYIPRHFSVEDPVAQEFLANLKSGHLVTNTAQGMLSTMIPVTFDKADRSVIGHVARGNSQWSEKTNQEALFISAPVDSYISPSWYASKQEHGKVVPTWDYMLAHVYGDLIIHDDVDWLRIAVSNLTDSFEAGRAKPWKLDDAPEDYVAGQLRAIVGVEIKVARLEVSFKMSQNKTIADLDGVIDGLRADNREDAASKVEDLRPRGKL
ncbi:transcriptional regulator [Candidatus Planktophila limnetica]|uniref:Transcriptional regulator n=1 Tax=Candidatus Planktophila limnetica TaxID=573600 RepID=A0A249LEU0_9ACTN|nr:FMN-binding negative transcriptional regulator [Candidatus Planktophila limnetica]ASY27641.1 transcriptional regulator [Candidatus Planktophila limnetica]